MTGPQRASSISLVLGAVLSVQLGAAAATTLFDEVGPGGAVLLRVALAALVLLVLWRPTLRGHLRADLRLAALFGISLAGMNLSFYEALDRIPLGIAVTLEFVGPLGVAIAGSRRRLDLAWAGMAAAGIVLLSPGVRESIDLLGAALALLAGGFWAAYIVLSARIGRVFPGGSGLAIAMVIASIGLIPVGVADGGSELLAAEILAVGLAVGLLSSAIPYSLELEALRRLPQRTFGVLMSLEPAVAALVGLIALDQGLAATEVLAIVLVVIASAGALGTADAPTPVEA